ncbi:hypothetical protein FIV06_01510 [Labrenzia sp. THAF191b]|nr:hypothetical protein FIV06_01510 [Labrenzia sp. THAF191b]QFT02391.1 hypothetical protein FIV05_01510 [Labrenzia sp. THAF191a]QFT13933.1 hypothetical protein FIV03_01515 [Labrenzia sp. THAF187b]
MSIFRLFRSRFSFKSERNENTQAASIRGDGNVVNQSVQNFWLLDSEAAKARKLVEAADVPFELDGRASLTVEEPDRDDCEEIRRILDYRKIANRGDSDTSLSLLRKLGEEEKYSSGYLGFRLHFNIGVVQHGIGEYQEASKSLRLAHSLCPSDFKAQTGLAFAELLDGDNQSALQRCLTLLQEKGDHRSLAASLYCHAARFTEHEKAPEDLLGEELFAPDVVVAYLDYIQDVRPDDYHEVLSKIYEGDKDNNHVASMWALATLDDARQNQAFLLGARMPDDYENRLAKSAEILKRDLVEALEFRPPNKLLLPSQVNNAAIALRLSGSVADAAHLIDQTLAKYPELKSQLAQIRAVLFLQEDGDTEALELICPLSDVPELQIMASEIEAKLGESTVALKRIDAVLSADLPEELLPVALETKARMAISFLSREPADEALEELVAITPERPEVLLLRSAYERAFVLREENDEIEALPISVTGTKFDEKKVLSSLENADKWDFLTILKTADELFARGYYRECADLLIDRVSFSSESPALSTLCDACLRGHLSRISIEIVKKLSQNVKNSVFGWRFCSNVAILSGEYSKVVPLARKLFEHSPSSMSALQWYVQALFRTNERARIRRLIKDLDDLELVGTIDERCEYVNILVYCGEIERARNYAYRLYCQNQNHHRAWMALSASVLAFGRPPGTADNITATVVQEGSTFEVLKSDESKLSFTIETNEELFALREGNIGRDHPVAVAALGKEVNEEFDWPLKGQGVAKIISVKHKVLAAFHQIIEKFEEQFPEASGFKSVSVNFSSEDGLDEMKAMLRQRADYSQQKAKEYSEGTYPLYILAFHLGIDPIDAMLGLKSECGYPLKVSSCSVEDQANAANDIRDARKCGIIAESCACYLIRRLGIEEAIKAEFGRIGITQEAVDIFAERLQSLETSCFQDGDTGPKKSSSIAVRGDQIVLTEWSEEEVTSKLELMRSDLDWIKSDCVLVPAVAKVDPNDEIIRARQEKGGRFFDDIFAADGTDRLFLSDDYHLRAWAGQLFGVKTAWIQALLFHLESSGRIGAEDVVKCTLQLRELGEEALSTNANRILVAAQMLSKSEISEGEFADFCSLLGQPGADLKSHIQVALGAITGLWEFDGLNEIKEKATSIILQKLVRGQADQARGVLNTVQKIFQHDEIGAYIAKWRIGHFLT